MYLLWWPVTDQQETLHEIIFINQDLPFIYSDTHNFMVINLFRCYGNDIHKVTQRKMQNKFTRCIIKSLFQVLDTMPLKWWRLQTTPELCTVHSKLIPFLLTFKHYLGRVGLAHGHDSGAPAWNQQQLVGNCKGRWLRGLLSAPGFKRHQDSASENGKKI